MEAGYNPRTVEEVFRDFKGRRAGLIKALTTDVEEFYQQCDPEKENLCLYGFPSEQWEVNLPAEEVPPELPEPALGINFARDGMQEKDWLSLVAVHSDAWLLAVAFYFGARFGFDKADSDHLKPRENCQSHSQKMKKRAWMRKKMMSMERLYVVPVGITMHQMNSGFVATYVRSGFMESVSRLLLLELSISSSTSVLHAATKELALSVERKSLAL